MAAGQVRKIFGLALEALDLLPVNYASVALILLGLALASQTGQDHPRRSEQQNAEKLVEAARWLVREPESFQLQFLQILTETTADKSHTLVFPLRMVLL